MFSKRNWLQGLFLPGPGVIYMYIIILVKQVYWYVSRVSGERLQDHWSSGFFLLPSYEVVTHIKKYRVLNLHIYLHTVKLLYDSWLWWKASGTKLFSNKNWYLDFKHVVSVFNYESLKRVWCYRRKIAMKKIKGKQLEKYPSIVSLCFTRFEVIEQER